MPAADDPGRFAGGAGGIAEVEGWLTDAQARRLHGAARALGPGATVVEIGSFRGRSTIVLARAAPDGAAVVAIDPHGGGDRGPREIAPDAALGHADHAAFRANLAAAGVAPRVRHVRKPSSEAHSEVDGAIDLLYVDGAHRLGPARSDISHWGDRVAEGGTMLVHDAFSSVGVTLALLSTTFACRRWRFVGRTGSLAEYRRPPGRRAPPGRAAAVVRAQRHRQSLDRGSDGPPHAAAGPSGRALALLKARSGGRLSQPRPACDTGGLDLVSDLTPRPASEADVLRWAESLAAIARTGLGFTESRYEQERFEEVLAVAADIRAHSAVGIDAGHQVQEWLDRVGSGVAGYVTPKVTVGAIVGDDAGRILLVQRADSGYWLYPTGWADVGYSPAEVAVKEVHEETGIHCEVLRPIAVIDGMRRGFTRIPLVSLVFHCRSLGGELKAHPLECSDVGFFAEGELPERTASPELWAAHAFAAIRGDDVDVLFDRPRTPPWRV